MSKGTPIMMTAENSMAVKAVEKLKGAFYDAGFETFKKRTHNGMPFEVTAYGQDGLDLDLRPSVALFEEDAYPNERDEVFLYTYTFLGSALKKNNELMRALQNHGFRARFTKRRGDPGIAVVLTDMY